MEKIDLDAIRMDLVQVREAIDVAVTVLEFKDDVHIGKQLEDLRKEEAMLTARLQEWSV